MLEFFRGLFGTDFMPHLYCLRSDPGTLWLHVVSDLAIAAAYFAIPLVLFDVVRKRTVLLFRKVALLFVLFITACGTAHVLAVWTVWIPIYRFEGMAKAATALFSIITAVVLVRLRPTLLKLPSVAQLESEIEERIRIERTAHEKEEQLRNFVESVQDYALYWVDIDGVIRCWNAGAERMTGYTAEEMIGQSCPHGFVSNTSGDPNWGSPGEILRTVQETGRFEGEGRMLRKDGTAFLAHLIMRPLRDSHGVLTGFSKVTRDITESRELETRFQVLLEAAPDAFLIVNRAGGIEFINAQGEKLFGYARAEVLGKSVDIFNPERVREAQAIYRDRIFAGLGRAEGGADVELLGLRKDGSEFPLEFTLSPLDTKEGRVFLFAIRDITERKTAARHLAEKMTELHQSNEALEQFAHIASHDLQEPLRMVASYTQLLSRRYKGRLDADADEFIDFAVDGTQRMKRLIEDLLLYSRAGKGAPPMEKFDAERPLREAIRNLCAAIEESGAEVTSGPLPALVAVESQLVQIFQNLIGNAIKYRGDRVPHIHVSAVEGSGEWVFSVADNGIGIDSRYYERIFQIFQRLHGRGEYEGTGIGLAICKRILQQQGGRIWVESEPGQGSVFHFSLPKR